MIHARVAPRRWAVRVLNCATLNPARLEEELFGVEAGADPVARSRAAPACWNARMAARCCSTRSPTCRWRPRARSCALLQEQSFERIGGGTRVKVDVRVIATTNRDLQRRDRRRPFREDLFYRLNVVPLRVPAADASGARTCPTLVRHFMERSAETTGMPRRDLAEDAMATLQAYDWPGNVRQLRNLVDWLLIMAPGESREAIRRRHAAARGGRPRAPTLSKLDRNSEIMTLPLRDARELFEKAISGGPARCASAATSRAPPASSAWSAARCTAN